MTPKEVAYFFAGALVGIVLAHMQFMGGMA
jgi:hypothetical protein